MHNNTYIRYKIKNKQRQKGGEGDPPTGASTPAQVQSPNDSVNNMDLIYNIYDPIYKPPVWAKEKLKTVAFYEKYAPSTRVYYPASADLDVVKKLTIEREPVNMELVRHYDKDKLKSTFGWEYGYYKAYYDTNQKLAPNIAIYCQTPVDVDPVGTGPDSTTIPDSNLKDIHIINVIGYAFDNQGQPDYFYFKAKNFDRTELLSAYNNIFSKIKKCAKDHKLTTIVMSLFGANNFATLYLDLNDKFEGPKRFRQDIWYPAFFDFSNSVLDIDIKFMGAENEIGDINKILKKNYVDIGPFPQNIRSIDPATTLFVNSWDPWSLVGNGNSHDRSLDGTVGRRTPLAMLCWPYVNNYLLNNDRYVPVMNCVDPNCIKQEACRKECFPSLPPGLRPVSRPVSAPVSVPVSAPVSAPVSVPVGRPVSAPVSVPISVPISAPVSVPVKAIVPAGPPPRPVSQPPTSSYPNKVKIEGPLKDLRNQLLLFYKGLSCCNNEMNGALTTKLNSKQLEFLNIIKEEVNEASKQINGHLISNAQKYNVLGKYGDVVSFNSEEEAYNFFKENMVPFINIIATVMKTMHENIRNKIIEAHLPLYRIYTSRELETRITPEGKDHCDHYKVETCCDFSNYYDCYIAHLINQQLIRIVFPVMELVKNEALTNAANKAELCTYHSILETYQSYINKECWRKLEVYTNKYFCVNNDTKQKQKGECPYGSTIIYIGKDDPKYIQELKSQIKPSIQEGINYKQTVFISKCSQDEKCDHVVMFKETPEPQKYC